MNIQIFGTRKSFDTKKAERYFKERSIKFQFIDMKEKGMKAVTVSTGADEEHAPARRAYERAGFKIHQDSVMYCKML